MKIVIKRIESIDRKGVNKETGKEWHIDTTNIISDVPFSDEKNLDNNKTIAFGSKDLVYQVGTTSSHEHFFTMGLDKLNGMLPIECDVELSQGLDAFGNPKPCITSINLPKTPIKQG